MSFRSQDPGARELIERRHRNNLVSEVSPIRLCRRRPKSLLTTALRWSMTRPGPAWILLWIMAHDCRVFHVAFRAAVPFNFDVVVNGLASSFQLRIGGCRRQILSSRIRIVCLEVGWQRKVLIEGCLPQECKAFSLCAEEPFARVGVVEHPEWVLLGVLLLLLLLPLRGGGHRLAFVELPRLPVFERGAVLDLGSFAIGHLALGIDVLNQPSAFGRFLIETPLNRPNEIAALTGRWFDLGLDLNFLPTRWIGVIEWITANILV